MARAKKTKRKKPQTPHGASRPVTQDMTLRQVAHSLQVSRDTVRRLCNSGQIPHRKVGRQLRFDLLAVRAALDRGT